MGRAPCCSKVGLHRGPWTPREDTLLTKYIQAHGEGHWRSLPKNADLEWRQSLVPPTNTLDVEKLYEEYLQLLEIDGRQDQVLLDSFADSLLV
ncbi:hypothetical protein D5086_026048 [Populus alba]|uniref:Uncharacterized protein n=1 Tax=Populus alba TaxID=43335 RepID=A0ACC4B0V7_POPAL